ncbi:ATP-dependent RNA helicase [Melia azedarach]|uniref:ATP-dependent RNA helicase n=2 Tax=Melia azedarach TaxID=155640 RepID=A0ACC1XDH2_MELAZ|nr:ATP-dependent RNA helicase [Melia azedarach]KAJ4709435.1 ATP-dependent RNA helicase [Melia azedarach]
MEKTKRVSLGVQKKKYKIKPSRRNKRTLLNNVVDYLKSDSYMFAPLINSPPPKINFPAATGLELKEPIKGKKERLPKKIVDYLKSDSYMYASCSDPQPISSPSKGSIRYVKRVSMEISKRTLTMEDNQPMVKSANMMAEDQFFKGNILETCNSDSQTLAHKELAKNVVYPNCRSSSVSGMLDSQLRKLLVD